MGQNPFLPHLSFLPRLNDRWYLSLPSRAHIVQIPSVLFNPENKAYLGETIYNCNPF